MCKLNQCSWIEEDISGFQDSDFLLLPPNFFSSPLELVTKDNSGELDMLELREALSSLSVP